MHEVIQFLQENPVQYLATTAQDGTPRVRPFMFMLENAGRLYFCTSSQKDVYREIERQPVIELCVSSPSYEWIRLKGEVEFDDDLAVKEAVIESSPLVKSIYQTAANPAFEIFYLREASAVMADFSGNPPRTFQL